MEKTWQEIAILVFLLIFFVVGIVAVFSTRSALNKQPSVSINLDDTTYTDKSSIPITGKAENTKTLTVNGQEIATDKSGNFSATVNLADGNNDIKVVAKNGSKEADVNKLVVKESGQSVAGTSNQPQAGGSAALNQSGPAEDISGIIGLSAILLSLFYYFERKNKAKFGNL